MTWVPDAGAAVTLDRSAVAAFRDGNPDGGPEFLIAPIDLYLVEAAARIADIPDAVRCLDQSRLKAAAHSLKGSLLVMGAVRLAGLCAQVEDAVTQHPDAVVTSAAAVIDQELVRVRAAFVDERY